MRQAYLPAGYNEQAWLKGCVKEVDRELFFEKLYERFGDKLNTVLEYITTAFFVITMFFGAYVALWALA